MTAMMLGRTARRRGKLTFIPNLSGDGDSISAQASYGFMTRAFADYTAQGITCVNLSVAGACIAATENATNNLMGRIAQVVASGSTCHIVAIGTNDLAAIDANTTISRLTDYVNALRAAGYSGKIVVCGVGPCSPSSTGGHASVNARRASYNAQARALVGTLIDGYMPRGEHPAYDTDAAASNTAWWNADGIHPTQVPHRAYWQIMHDVLDPYIAQAGGAAVNPTLSFQSMTDVPVTTPVTTRARVTGLGLGQTASLAVAGGATTSRGLGAFDGTDKVLMNGDVPQIQAVPSSANSTVVTNTVTFNGVASNWSLTTQPASYPAATTTLDAAHKASTVTLSGAPPLTATAGSGGGNQLAMATVPLARKRGYLEVTMGIAGDTGNGKKISIHDASLIGHYTSIAGSSAGFTAAGLTIVGGSGTVNLNGAVLTAVDFLNVPAMVPASVVGVLIDADAGKVWLRTASGFWPGDPTVGDGGLVLPAPLAAYYASALVQTNAQGETFNYGGPGGADFTYGLPLGFGPYG